MTDAYSKGGARCHFSKKAKEEAYERIRSGEFSSREEIAGAFGICRSTASAWIRDSGYVFFRERELPDRRTRTEAAMEGNKREDGPKGEWKGAAFVEPDPGADSFGSEREALEYYRLRAEYLENLYMLADRPTDVKKKALRLLEERVRERMAKGGS